MPGGDGVPGESDHGSSASRPAVRLVDRLREVMRTRRYSPRTEQAYLGWIRRFIRHHGRRHPRELGEAEVNAFLTHLAVREHVSASTQNQALAALLFLYGNVLEMPLGRVGAVVRAKRPKRLPVVLTREEVRLVLTELDGTPRLVAMLLYGAGLRLNTSAIARGGSAEFRCRMH